jgi:hypothetical protein
MPVTVTAQDVAPAANAIAGIIRLRLPPGQEILRVESPSDESGQAIRQELVRVLQTQGYRIEDNPRASHRIGFAVTPLKMGALLTVTIDGGTAATLVTRDAAGTMVLASSLSFREALP